MRRAKWIRWLGLSLAALPVLQLASCTPQDLVNAGLTLTWLQLLGNLLGGGTA